MKVTSKIGERGPVTIKGSAIPIGTAFVGRIPEYGPGYFLRTYAGLVDFSNSHKTWSCDYSGPTVNEYRPVDAEVVIHGYAN